MRFFLNMRLFPRCAKKSAFTVFKDKGSGEFRRMLDAKMKWLRSMPICADAKLNG